MSASGGVDVAIAGGGIVGAACALACAKRGLRVTLIERDVLGSGATAAGMGHVVVMDDSDAQFALTRYSQQLWIQLADGLPPEAEYEECGTIWVAADGEEMDAAERKHAWYSQRGVPCELLSAEQLRRSEPNLVGALAGGLLVREDAVVYPPVVALQLARRAEAVGARLVIGQTVREVHSDRLVLEDGTEVHAEQILVALGAESVALLPHLPVRKRKGHLVITDRYAGYVRHQLVELGYLKSAHSTEGDSVAFNVQPRKTGQLLIGSSRQYGVETPAVDQHILTAMLKRASRYMPGLNSLRVIRAWTGFRAATPDKLPLIGPDTRDASVLLATGHEGLGITTSLATAELIAAQLTNQAAAIELKPYLPARFAQRDPNERKEEDKHAVDWSHAGVDNGI
jgi:glycine/D-amino acid oxidase-like deaminating enzyme